MAITFTSATDSTTVTVNDSDHGAIVGDFVNFPFDCCCWLCSADVNIVFVCCPAHAHQFPIFGCIVMIPLMDRVWFGERLSLADMCSDTVANFHNYLKLQI